MMWAIRIVQKPSWPARPADTNSASSDEPITISGAAIGKKIRTFVLDRPTKSCRTSANPASVPRTVAPRVARSPISMLRFRASHMLGSAHGWSQLSRVKELNL